MHKKIKLKNNKTAHIQLIQEVERVNGNLIFEKIKPTKNGYAGYREGKYLPESLHGFIFSSLENKGVDLSIGVGDVLGIIKKTLNAVVETLPTKNNLEIYIFPTLSGFVKEKMFGVNGYTPYANVIHLYVHPDSTKLKDFNKNLANTLAHEYNHAIRFLYFPNSDSEKLIDNLVFEGLAENFREYVLGGKQAPWAQALSKDVARKVFDSFGGLLLSDNYTYDDYNKIFFGNDEYAVWTGYSVGYHLVKDFIKNRGSERNWSKIIQMPAKEILEKSGW
ncbi:hypothetical protein A2886_02330 [candidate division WWE3 bacterium RIFCSPHIGHO2_01_FULL_42_13]|uniref:DUF2268 domain-containing protein n=1 Tax=candidate division WWE3 bacterium RIFCSPHIGHO2_01_FULL_42_13 TaxID=1802617 RepID=A0A1F4URK0_UNCKA|nr:MAG: hypothetical protein A2886_02330 [candidate division WWE3 bacterium RIFCSPHIGHO2_01_FULL_42_13]